MYRSLAIWRSRVYNYGLFPDPVNGCNQKVVFLRRVTRQRLRNFHQEASFAAKCQTKVKRNLFVEIDEYRGTYNFELNVYTFLFYYSFM